MSRSETRSVHSNRTLRADTRVRDAQEGCSVRVRYRRTGKNMVPRVRRQRR